MPAASPRRSPRRRWSAPARTPTRCARSTPWPHVVHAGPFTRRLPADRALDPGELGAGHRHAGGAHPAHAATSRPTRRRWSASRSTRRRSARSATTGVKVLACDSTNVFNAHAGRSEATLIEPIGRADARGRGHGGRHHLRLERRAAADAGRGRPRRRARRWWCSGRAMNTMLKTAHAAEVLDGFPATLDPLDADAVPRRHLLVLATGSQGERRAASAQLAQGKYMGLELRRGRHLPVLVQDHPRQRGRGRAHPEQLSARRASPSSTTGRPLPRLGPRQPARPRRRCRSWCGPRMLVPMHGEHRHLAAHAALGRGARASPRRWRRTARMLDLTGDAPRIVEQVETGRVYLDGTRADRRAWTGWCATASAWRLRGHVAVSVIIDERGRPLGGAWVEATGLPDNREDARRARGSAGGRARPGARRAPSGRSSTTTTRSRRADPARVSRGSATTRSARSRSAR